MWNLENIILYHYYNKNTEPFLNLSELTDEEAKNVLKNIKTTSPSCFIAKRTDEYMKMRRYYEDILLHEFTKKGGTILRKSPHYFVIGPCEFLESWYDKPEIIKIPLKEFDLQNVSFTYGDSHPTFSEKVNDGKEYRKKLYTFEEIIPILNKYGLPQEWNPKGDKGPERYVEVHVWSDDTILRYLKQKKSV